MKAYKDLIFDIDGTLIDTERVVLTELDELLRNEYGIEIPYEDLKVTLGIPMIKGLEALGFEGEKKEEIHDKWQKRLDIAEATVKPMPQIPELLPKLRDLGYRLGIVTSRDRPSIEDSPSIHPLLPYMDFVVTSDMTENHKPSGDPIRRYLDEVGGDNAHAMYIGDSVYDMKSAKDAGVTAAMAGWGAAAGGRELADVVLTNPDSLLEYLAKEK